MKKGPLLLIVILIFGIGVLLLVRKKEVTKPISLPAPTNSAVSVETQKEVSSPSIGGSRVEGSNAAEQVSPPTTTTNRAEPAVSSPQAANETAAAVPVLPPLTILDNARVAVHNYHDAFGENPVGNNAEITAALHGNNPRQVNFIREDAGLRVNEKGEMIDAYGTPFFFHQVSANLMEIRSAGQDRKLWTFDDIVTR